MLVAGSQKTSKCVDCRLCDGNDYQVGRRGTGQCIPSALCIFVLTWLWAEAAWSQQITPNIQSAVNKVSSSINIWLSRRPDRGHERDNSIDNFYILFNVAEPSDWREERRERSQSDSRDAPNKMIDTSSYPQLQLSLLHNGGLTTCI